MIADKAQSNSPVAYTDSETYTDERTVPMNNAPRELSRGYNAGMAEKGLKSENEE